ncbi:MAG: 2TM domain-containing protein [Sediminicola sp.]|tara:strand:+ start:55266 stop:55574 length:309 start_codon:yes stop_codon:yes gene_type:complete
MVSQNSYVSARERLRKLKELYAHMAVFLIVNVPLLAMYFRFRDSIDLGDDPNTLYWVDVNIFFMSGIWSLCLVAQACTNSLWYRKWEEKQIRKFMEGDQGRE